MISNTFLTIIFIFAYVASAQLMRHDLAHNNKLVANRNRNLMNDGHAFTQRVEVEDFGLSATISGMQRRVEDASIGKELDLRNTLLGHTSAVNSVAFNEDGTRIASGSYDKTIKIWDMSKGGELLQSLNGHTSYVFSVAYSKGGTQLASGSGDNTIKIWEPAGSPTSPPSFPPTPSLSYSPTTSNPEDKDSAVTQSLSITTIAILVSASIFSLCLGIFCFFQRHYIVDFIRSRIIRSRTGNKDILEHNLTGGTFELVESESQNQASRQTVID